MIGRRHRAKRPLAGRPVPAVSRLIAASVVDGVLFTAAVLPTLWAEGAAPGLHSTSADDLDPQDLPSWSEIRARIRADVPDPALEARLRRIAWRHGVVFLAGMAWADVRLDGQTPGRALAGIRLVRRDGTALTVSHAVLRECAPAARQLAADAVLRVAVPDDRLVRSLARVAAAFLPLAFVLLDPERRTLGDHLAGTRLTAARS